MELEHQQSDIVYFTNFPPSFDKHQKEVGEEWLGEGDGTKCSDSNFVGLNIVFNISVHACKCYLSVLIIIMLFTRYVYNSYI